MKTKFLILLTGVFLSAGVLNAQQVDCNTELSLFSQSAKIKDYKTAKPHYDKLIQNCPDSHMAIYQYGERMFKGLLKKGDEAKKEAYAKGLIENHKKRLEYFPAKTKKGETYADIAQVMYDNKIGTKEEQYQAFDKAWKADKDSFNSPKALYTYFSLLVDLQDEGEKDLKEVFLKYDELIQKIENQEIVRAEEAQPLIEKQEMNEELTSAEKRVLKNSEIYLTNFSKIKGGINQKLGERADCENLIPLYNKDFDENKNDVDWLKRAAARLSAKECTKDPLFFKLVEALHQKEPSAKSALYLGQLASKDGNASKALEYYNQSAELEDNNLDKARVYKMIAGNYKSRGQYSSARKYYRRALKAQPSLGSAYLQIASMYAKSANDCGDNIFEKRAVYWLAADYARRAGRVNPAIKSSADQAANSYMGRAPQKSDIFQYDYKPGSRINIGCWIGESVTVPSL
ncbi:tetratricopeptide repeat protein [Haloflavibacter putidus]|uniref:Tetratricopeptide repeat protein n=1 Tax=Haloflavibacter putidus TaxID=2576776 RepID=A0A507ZS37_9FLAO|nr:tetratricopeptide repeat protein [Haloflavibacter putidus]TQD38528.1 tetratricopeptide repeat protein [Haloflavibacter putidus]